jgi:F-type H+-transporting ATPase subunit b
MNVTATLFGQIITFAVLVFFVNRFLWEPRTEAMAARTRRSREGLEAAEQGRQQKKRAQKRATDIIREARREKDRIIARAHQRGAEIIEKAKQEAEEEKRRRLQAARAEIEREYNQARENLRSSVNRLIVEGAGQVLQSEIDMSAHEKLVEELTARL